MQKTAFRFGLYSLYTITGFFFVTWLLSQQQSQDYGVREVVGWAGILLSVIFVYFGLKYYRDKIKGGILSFSEGMKLGLLIVLFPAFAYGIFDVIYVTLLDPTFLDKYYSYQVAQIKNTLPPSEFNLKLKEMQEQKAMFSNLFVQFAAMFLCVFIAGLIVTLISTLILKRKAPQFASAR